MHLTFSWWKHPCSNSEVEALYKTLAAQCHPDKIVQDTTLKDAAQTATQMLNATRARRAPLVRMKPVHKKYKYKLPKGFFDLGHGLSH